MATLKSSLVVRLLDQVSAPAKGVMGSLLGISAAAGRFGKIPFGERLKTAIERNNASLDAARGRMLDAIGTIYALKAALSKPIGVAMAFETILEDIGQKADLSGAALDTLGKKIRQVARATNQTGQQTAESVDFLIGMGASSDDALSMADPIGKAATAYRASALDLSKSAFAVFDNLKVPINQIGRAMDVMAQSGKEGGFELKDMASEFPGITAAAQALGMHGVEAVADLTAALEVARKGTATGAEAANNMANFMQKIVSKDAIKNLKKFGVNVPKELKKAAAAGVSPIEHMLGIIDKITEGGKPELLSQIFGDKQVLEFIRPMLANMKEYRRIRAAAMKAQGVVEADYERRLSTTLGKVQAFKAGMENLALSIGSALLPSVVEITDAIGAMAAKFADFAEKNPEVVASITKTVAALVGFKVATSALTFMGLMGRGGALSMISLGFNTVGKAAGGAFRAARSAVALQRALGAMEGLKLGKLATISTALRGMLFAVPGVSMIAGALSAVGAALAAISAPLWIGIAAAVALVAAAGYALWRYWDRVSSVVAGVARRIGEELSPVIEAFAPVLEAIKPVIQAIGDAFDWLGQKVNEVLEFFGSFFQKEVLSEAEQNKIESNAYALTDKIINAFKASHILLINAGIDMVQSLWDGMVQKFDEFIEWIKTIPERIVSSIGTIDFSNIIKMPTLPSWMGGEADGTSVAAGGTPSGKVVPAAKSSGMFDWLPSWGKSSDAMPGTNANTSLSSAKDSSDGVQQVQVMNQQAPNISVSINAPITVNEASDAAAIAGRLGGELKSRMDGLMGDLEHAAGQ